MIQGKVWGITKLLEKNSSFEFHRISVLAGGVCSKHRHKHKWNGFFVESGELLVRVWKDYGLVDEVILCAGDYTRVTPGEYHQFEALGDTVAFETYWVEFNSDDIERETVGYHNESRY
jgi:mannose-6-phosphate isomerase-like protein (cupin superfamily)